MRILRELDLDGLDLLPVLVHHEAHARPLAGPLRAANDLGDLAGRELDDGAHRQEAERRHEHAQRGAVLRVLQLLGERGHRVVGRGRQEPGLGREQIVVAPRDRDELRVQRRRTRSPVHRPEPRLTAKPERLEREDGTRDRRLVDATERGENGRGARREAILLILRERRRGLHSRHRRARRLRERHARADARRRASSRPSRSARGSRDPA